MRPKCLLIAVSALALAGAGCSATPTIGASLTLEGTLVLKGNEPHVTPVLVRSATEQWELQQVAREKAATLQNTRVEAAGVVTRAPGQGSQLPALAVTSLRAKR